MENKISIDEKLEKITIFISSYLPGFKAGGPIKSVANMISVLGELYAFDVYTSDRDLGMTSPYKEISLNTPVRVGCATVFYCSVNFKGLIFFFKKLVNIKSSSFYFSSFFSFKFSVVPYLVILMLRPKALRIVAPRGEFSIGALSIKQRKKSVFLSIVKLFGFYDSAVWHASSENEAKDIRRIFGSSAEIRIAIDLASFSESKVHPAKKEEKKIRIVFLSRICEMKNLQAIVEILANATSEITFDIYGPIEDIEYWAECERRFKSLPSRVVVTYRGIADSDKVISIISQYDLFLLPTLGENFGHVIAESLFAGVPVLISDRTPWADLEEKRLGWNLPLIEMKKFSECIDKCAAISTENYSIWRERIQRWAEANVNDGGAIKQNHDLFLKSELN